MNFNELTKHIRQLNELEQIKHHQRAQAAIERIKEFRQRARAQQETATSSDTSGHIR
jgi:ribosomal protein L31E